MKSLTSTKEIWSDPEYCKSEIMKAREIMSSRKTTRKQFEQIQKALGLMYLHCPDEMAGHAYACLQEATMRYVFFDMGIWDPV